MPFGNDSLIEVSLLVSFLKHLYIPKERKNYVTSGKKKKELKKKILWQLSSFFEHFLHLKQVKLSCIDIVWDI